MDVPRFGIGFTGELPFCEMVNQVTACEEAGFESAWVAEDYFLRDAISIVAGFATLTRRIKLGIGVVNPYTRNVALMAMTVATLDEISNGRLLFGIGSGVKSIHERMGMRVDKRLMAIRENVEVLRRLMTRETITYTGQTLTVRSVRLGFEPSRQELPIYLAAVGPNMLQLAGEIADGVLLTAASSPKYVAKAVENIRIGAENCGRDASSIDIACYVICSMSDDPSKAFEAARLPIGLTLSPPEYGRRMLEESGLDSSALGRIDIVPTDDKEIAKVSRGVTDEMVNALSASGTPERVRKKLDEYISAGVDLPILVPAGSCFAEIARYIQKEYPRMGYTRG